MSKLILKKPIVTEKSSKEYEENNVVTFEVNLNADKFEGIKALEEAFNVSVISARVINRLGKIGLDRRSRKSVRKKRDKKIMMFKLKEGDKISIFNQ